MSPSNYYKESEQYDDEDIVTIFDEEKRSLDCYIENSTEFNGEIYYLLLPIDAPVVIMADSEEEDYEGDEDEVGETYIVEDGKELEEIFPDAKAVLAELELTLKNTAFSLTVGGELPPVEEENLIILELGDDEDDYEGNNGDEEETDTEELQFLASFYHYEQKYNICTPLTPLLFVARPNAKGKLELLHQDDELFPQILDELLFDEME
jgi:hypothetical protein